MAVRTGYVGTQVAGDVLTAANFTKLPGGWIGYAEVTAIQSTISAEVDLTGLTVTVTAGTSRRIRITGQVRVSNDATAGNVIVRIKEDGVEVGRIFQDNVTASDIRSAHGSVVRTPSAGSRVYKLTQNKGTGAGTCSMDATATFPAYILVEDIGPAA